MKVPLNALKPIQIYLQCTYYHRSKAVFVLITAMMVATVIADSQVSLGLIAELLCVKHQYIELPRFHVDELDKLIEFLCCN